MIFILRSCNRILRFNLFIFYTQNYDTTNFVFPSMEKWREDRPVSVLRIKISIFPR